MAPPPAYELFDPRTTGGILISSANDIPGYTIDKVHGMVYGTTVTSRNAIVNLGMSLKSIGGGELHSWTKMVVKAREEAVERMVSAAKSSHANACYAVRFESSSIAAEIIEIICFGTAATIVPAAAEAHKA